MHSHLVTVEVGIEAGTSQWVQLDGLTLDHTWLESQDTMTVQGRSTVEEHWVTLHYVFEDIEYDWLFAVDDLLSRLNRLHDAALNEFADDEWFVELSSHIFRQTTLVHLQLWTYNDYRTSRIVHTFTEQVLTETTLFTLERVGE